VLLSSVERYEKVMHVYGFEAVGRSLKTMEQTMNAVCVWLSHARTVNAFPPLKQLSLAEN